MKPFLVQFAKETGTWYGSALFYLLELLYSSLVVAIETLNLIILISKLVLPD